MWAQQRIDGGEMSELKPPMTNMRTKTNHATLTFTQSTARVDLNIWFDDWTSAASSSDLAIARHSGPSAAG